MMKIKKMLICLLFVFACLGTTFASLSIANNNQKSVSAAGGDNFSITSYGLASGGILINYNKAGLTALALYANVNVTSKISITSVSGVTTIGGSTITVDNTSYDFRPNQLAGGMALYMYQAGTATERPFQVGEKITFEQGMPIASSGTEATTTTLDKSYTFEKVSTGWKFINENTNKQVAVLSAKNYPTTNSLEVTFNLDNSYTENYHWVARDDYNIYNYIELDGIKQSPCLDGVAFDIHQYGKTMWFVAVGNATIITLKQGMRFASGNGSPNAVINDDGYCLDKDYTFIRLGDNWQLYQVGQTTNSITGFMSHFDNSMLQFTLSVAEPVLSGSQCLPNILDYILINGQKPQKATNAKLTGAVINIGKDKLDLYSYNQGVSLPYSLDTKIILKKGLPLINSKLDRNYTYIYKATGWVEVIEEKISFNIATKTVSVNSQDDIQFWVKENKQLNGSDNTKIWVLKQAFAKNNSIKIDNAFIENEDSLQVLVRIRDVNGKVSQTYKTFKASDYLAKIDTIICGEQSYDKKDTIYLPKTNAVLDLTFKGINPTSVIVYGGSYANNKITFENFANTGIQYIDINTDGNIERIKVKVYDNSQDYTYITGVNFNNAGTATINVAKAGTLADYTGYFVVGHMAGQSINAKIETDAVNLTFNKLDAGYHYYCFQIMKDSKVVDYYSGYYKYGAPIENQIQGATLNGTVNTPITIGQELATENKEYQIIKWDAKGEHIVKDYNVTSSKLDFTFTTKGIYEFQYRVRTKNSNVSFEDEKYINVTIDSVKQLDFTIDVATNIEDRTPTTLTVNNNNEKETVMYKYIIHSNGLWIVEEFYSPSNTFIFVPNKIGKYTIEVRAISNGSFGYADTVKVSQEITVI